MLLPIPYEQHELEAAFPELDVSEVLGEGTFKIAYLAKKSDEALVLKVVKEPLVAQNTEGTSSASHAGSETVDDDLGIQLPDRVGREVRAMQSVDSPRVARIIDGPDTREIGSVTCLWYAEPYYSGGRLTDKLNGAMKADEVRVLGGDLLDGLGAIHERSLIHRDIKPDNIVFDSTDSAVILDLGIALHTDLDDLTGSDQVSPKTETYCAPEQFGIKRSVVIDGRTDLFQVGIVLFQALTSRHPFKPTGPRDAYIARLSSHGIDQGALDAIDNEAGLKQVIVRLLQPSLSKRYRNVSAARKALEEIDK